MTYFLIVTCHLEYILKKFSLYAYIIFTNEFSSILIGITKRLFLIGNKNFQSIF